MLIVDGANPVFTTPRAWRVREAFEKVPYIVSFGSFLDETSILSDLILPDHSFLEGWSEGVPESGSLMAVASVAPAAMRPLYQTRATGDVLLEIGRGLQRPLELPWQTFDEMLGATFAALPSSTPDVDAWTDAQAKGVWVGTLPPTLTTTSASPAAAAAPLAYVPPSFDGDAGQFPLHFLPYPSSAFLDGSLAHLPWLQEMPDPLTSAMWSSWVEINPVDGGETRYRRRRCGRGGVRAGVAALGGRAFTGHCAERDRHARRAGTSDIHAIRERQG